MPQDIPRSRVAVDTLMARIRFSFYVAQKSTNLIFALLYINVSYCICGIKYKHLRLLYTHLFYQIIDKCEPITSVLTDCGDDHNFSNKL